jgi:hypothetical protein
MVQAREANSTHPRSVTPPVFFLPCTTMANWQAEGKQGRGQS